MKNKFAFFTLLLTALILLCGCTQNDGVPYGMQTALDGSDGVKLFVPAEYTVVKSHGSVYAYVSAVDTTGITFTYTDTTYESGKDAYLGGKSLMESTLPGFTEESTDGTLTLSYADTYAVVYSYTVEDTLYRAEAYYTVESGRLYILTYSEKALENGFTDAEQDMYDILENIVFTGERSENKGESLAAFEDDRTPDAMKRASDPAIAMYRLYVPEDWVILEADDTTLVCKSDSDRTSVNVYMTVPAETDVMTYFTNYKTKLSLLYPDLTTVEVTDRLEFANGYTAYRVVYTGTYNGKDYKVEQYFFMQSYYLFAITYTARTANFERNHADFEKMLDAFRLGD